MEIDEIDGNNGLIYRLKKLTKYSKLTAEREREREINEMVLVQNVADELTLLA